MDKKRALFICKITLIVLAISFTGCVKDTPLKIIFDTDIGNDIDDVMALQMLLNYQKNSKIDLLGITISKSNPYTIEYVDGFCRFHDIKNVPIGFIYEGPNNDNGKYLKQTLDTIIGGKHILTPELTVKSYVLDAWELQRKLLSQSEDNSVVIIAVGPLTNLRRLLESSGDQYSPLNGMDLVSRKVDFLSVMGGEFSGAKNFVEWNIEQDIESAMIVFHNWPTKIIASGWEIGNKLLYPHQSILNDFNNATTHPLCVSYKLFSKMPYDRQTWDLTSVLYAVEPGKNYFSLSTNGSIFINSEGNSSFLENKDGRHQFLKIDEEQIDSTLKKLVSTVTSKF